jgi:GTP-binding protein
MNNLIGLQNTYRGGRSGNGHPNNRHGKNGEDKIIDVPIGTVVKNSRGQILVDLIKPDSMFLIACGGEGGFGNKVFANNQNRTPR